REDVAADGLARERGLLVRPGGHPVEARRVVEADPALVDGVGIARELVDAEHPAHDLRVGHVELVGDGLVALEGERVDVVGEGQRVLPGRRGAGEDELIGCWIARPGLRSEGETEYGYGKSHSCHRVLAAKVAVAAFGGQAGGAATGCPK